MDILVNNLREVEITEAIRNVVLQLEIDKYQDLQDINPNNVPTYASISEFNEEEKAEIWEWFDTYQDDFVDHQKFVVQNADGDVVGIAEYQIIQTGGRHLILPDIRILQLFQRRGYGRPRGTISRDTSQYETQN